MKKIVLLTALAIAGFAVTSLAQTVPSNVPANGLVGWWPFNGNAIDESINTNDGTVNGATLTGDRFGNANSAYSFDGITNYIFIQNTLIQTVPSDLTISLWFKTTDLDANFISDRYTGINYFKYFVGISSGQIVHGNYSSGCNSPLFSASFTANNWNNLVVIKNSNLNLNSIYLNGSLVSSAPTICYHSANNPTQIGRWGGGNDGYYFGLLDDIGIWNRALTPSEITSLYNGNLCFQTITVTDTLLINTNITGFNPVTYQNTIKIWPNPTNDHITIDNGNLANLTGHQIKISNALGQQVFQSAITQQQFYVNMSTWGGNGIYFVNLINAQGVTIETRKIVLQ